MKEDKYLTVGTTVVITRGFDTVGFITHTNSKVEALRKVETYIKHYPVDLLGSKLTSLDGDEVTVEVYRTDNTPELANLMKCTKYSGGVAMYLYKVMDDNTGEITEEVIFGQS